MSVSIAACLLAACASNGRQPAHPAPVPDKAYEQEAVDPQKVQQLRVDVIRGLLDKGQYYAALAHIEEQKRSAETMELIFLEAEVRRHLGQRAQSEALYRKLLGSAAEGQAYHGLGLLLASSDIEVAIRNLRSAAERLPTDVEIRNDLGYALMEVGRYTEALPELSTAAELAPTQLKSRNNLIILMLLTGNQAGLAQLSQQAGTTPETMKQLREQAQSIRNQQAARAGRVPA
ncbi:MAG: hypothetical protein NVS9B10_17940 [Nevskia sp.]